jgi:hypothetical protein
LILFTANNSSECSVISHVQHLYVRKPTFKIWSCYSHWLANATRLSRKGMCPGRGILPVM